MIEKILKENKNILVFLLVLILGLPVAVASSYFLAFHQRVYPKTTVCQNALTGKTKREAETVIANLVKANSPSNITLTFEKDTFNLNPANIKYLSKDTATKALKLGRNKNIPLNLKEIGQLLLAGENIGMDFQIDNQKFDSEIATIAAKLYVSPIDPEIKIVKNLTEKKVVVETGKNGQEVNIRTLKKELFANLSCPQNEINIKISINAISSKITPAMAEETRKIATLFLNKELKLFFESQSWTINDEVMINFLAFEKGYDRSKITTFVHELAKTINSLPENASFLFETSSNKMVVFKPSKDGVTLNETELTNTIIGKLEQIKINQESAALDVPVSKTSAKISTGDANSLGIKEQVSKGTSLFIGSIPGRIHNIQLASLKLNGILIAAGETFSFNKALGDVSKDTGYEQAYIIKEGRTVLGDGGGVCQVSTTLFRAALNAGLPITERHAHAYRVHYYEDDLGPGFDATVFDPTADLKFINNTSSNLLVQTTVDLKRKLLTFELYGTKDSRKIEIAKVKVWDKQPPPPDLYQDDPTLPKGTIKQVDWSAWGTKAAFDYKVTKDSETIFEKTFTSIYKPWQAVYLRGTER